MAANQKRCLQGVLFDWDGTLIDSYRADACAYLAMFKEMGIAWGIEDLERHYSPDWYQVYRAAKLPRKLWDQADRAWRAHYAKHRPKLISGARPVLEVVRTKHLLEAACCVYVGDTPQDIEMARRAGVRAIGVLGPFPTEKRLRASRPEFLIGSLGELPGLLNRLRNGGQ